MIVSDPTTEPTRERAFADFMVEAEPRLRRALVARYGGEAGREATAEALAYGWQHWDRLAAMTNPVGYLYRVGQSHGRRMHRPRHAFPAPDARTMPWVEPALPSALAKLSPKQRQVVVLVHGFQYTHAEVANLLGISKSTVQNHVERGVASLRKRLAVRGA